MRKMYFNLRVLLAAFIACLVSVEMVADPISREQAKQRVMAFQKKQGDTRQLKAVTSEKRLAPRKGAVANEPFYVFDRGNNEGYVIASGDDQTIDVLGYTTEGTFDYEQLPPQLKDLLEVLGDRGVGCRTAIGVSSLPGNATLELNLVMSV